MRLLLQPRVTNRVLDRMGDRARMLDPILHNTVSPTGLHSDDKFNVIPARWRRCSTAGCCPASRRTTCSTSCARCSARMWSSRW